MRSELGDQHMATMAPCCGKPWFSVERVGPLPHPDLGERLDRFHAVLAGKNAAALPLGIQS